MFRSTKIVNDTLKTINLWRVWWFLGMQDIRARFRRSFIGPAWLLINLVFFVGGVGTVYGLLFGQPMHEFLPFLTSGFVIWAYIISSIIESCNSFVNAEGYIKQFCYPKQIYIFRSLVSYSTILAIGLLVLIPLQLYFHSFSIKGWLISIPGLLLLHLAGLGHSTISAYIGTRFRDLPHALGSILQVLFFVTPVMFPIKVLQEKHVDFIYQFNPLYYLIDVVRHPILQSEWAPVDSYIYAGIYILITWLSAFVVAAKFDSRIVFWL